MAVNRGKKFEEVIRNSFEKVKNTTVVRLPDPTSGYLGIRNISDFIVYHFPHQYFIECKTVHGNTLSIHSIPKPDKHGVLHGFYGDITDTQWEGLFEKSKVKGVVAGIICWWVDKDKTVFIPIQELVAMRIVGMKSVRYDAIDDCEGDTTMIEIKGKKKRVFFEYNMEQFFKEV